MEYGPWDIFLTFFFIFCHYWHPLTTLWTLLWGFWVKSLRWVLFSSRNRWLAHLRSNLWWGQTWQRSIWKFFLVSLSAEWRQSAELHGQVRNRKWLSSQPTWYGHTNIDTWWSCCEKAFEALGSYWVALCYTPNRSHVHMNWTHITNKTK